ncbi:MAG: sugar transferase [Spirochaetales bacterium]|nr:sugar transferase [Spirochaetales bacterium]
MNLAPVILFVYNRPEHTQKTLEALQQNHLSEQTDLYIFCDGAKSNASEIQLEKIAQTRDVVRSKKWCGNVYIEEALENKGLASSIISGVSKIMEKHGRAIVLEDDIVTGQFFLTYMNKALDLYRDTPQVWHINGWTNPVKATSCDSAFIYPVMDCWGWATWADRWKYYKKDCEYYCNKFSRKDIYHFNSEGTENRWKQILRNKSGKLNTWAIFWGATIFEHGGLCVAPQKTLVRNIGMDSSGENCYASPLHQIRDSIDYEITCFPQEIVVDEQMYKRLKNFFRRKNLITPGRIYRKLKSILKK